MDGHVINWMPAILALFGSLIVMLFSAWLNTRALTAQIDALRQEMRSELSAMRAEMRGEISTLRAEMKQSMAEMELRLTVQISNLSDRVEKLEDRGSGLLRP
ncbi:MAG: hypothetical protein HY820_36890 [Acidobacteria bacterium]|nr:hypothetical protein [Acidobacteriota bacterium]